MSWSWQLKAKLMIPAYPQLLDAGHIHSISCKINNLSSKLNFYAALESLSMQV